MIVFVPFVIAAVSGLALAAAESSPGDLLSTLKSLDATYQAGFAATGTALHPPSIGIPGLPSIQTRWRVTFQNMRAAVDEQTIGILQGTALPIQPNDGSSSDLPGRNGMRQTVPLKRSTLWGSEYVGRCILSAKEDVAIDGIATNQKPADASQRIAFRSPENKSYDLFLKQINWTMGRGFSSYLTQIDGVNVTDKGAWEVSAQGVDYNGSAGRWELVIEPDAAYLVRQAKYYKGEDSDPRVVIVNSGSRWTGPWCVPEKGTWTDPILRTPRDFNFLFESASAEVDETLLAKVEKDMKGPYEDPTTVTDYRMDPPFVATYVNDTMRLMQTTPPPSLAANTASATNDQSSTATENLTADATKTDDLQASRLITPSSIRPLRTARKTAATVLVVLVALGLTYVYVRKRMVRQAA